ncbi:MAG: hypothetical protein ABIG11_04670 [bacterium]
MDESRVNQVIAKLATEVPAAQKARLETGVRQAARLWNEYDGTPEEFAKFCESNFAAGGAEHDLILTRFQSKLESLRGHFTAMSLELRREQDEDRGDLKPIDRLFAAFAPAAHLADDLFKIKLAFLVALNFPVQTLEDCLALGAGWSRRQWAETRLAQAFAFRVPGDVQQKVAGIQSAAEAYVYSYNIFMDHMVGADGKPLFREGLKLISHWGLRDELKALYADSHGLERQKVIMTIMERIINQEIPRAVVDGDVHFWDPVGNMLDGKPAEREPDTRYATLLSLWRAARLEDPYYPTYPTLIDRSFRLGREMPEPEVEAILKSLLEAPAGKQLAALIEKRLKRKLLPFDIWYDGFKPPKGLGREELDDLVRKKYPTADAFSQDIPDILVKLGFAPETARFLAAHVEVDAARGAGHAAGADMRSDKSHLRTRINKDGMDYQGYNTAMHELGHCVEQTFSLQKIDNYLLAGVPNSAFTEGFAFLFQARDLEVLGLAKPDAKASALKHLDDFWMSREIAGVALVEMRIWHWMYDHPRTTPSQLREAMVAISKEVWNKYYAPVLGVKDSPVLAIYAHMFYYSLYIPNYLLGHVIASQVEDYFRTHPPGIDMERMCRIGNVTPAEWMRQAVGRPISTETIIREAKHALKFVREGAN